MPRTAGHRMRRWWGVVALAAVLCGAAWHLPTAAWATSGHDGPADSTAKNLKGNSATMKVDALRSLDYTLYPDDHVEQSVDPALRVTITGKEWRLYGTWDGGPASSVAYIRAAGGWMRLSAGQVLIASSAAAAPDKHADKSRTTVIDLALRLRIGADGTDAWSVRPGTYPGRLRLRLEGRLPCDSDEPEDHDSSERGPALMAPDAPALDASPTIEAPGPSGPATPSIPSEDGIETTPSVEASIPTSIADPVNSDEPAGIEDPAPIAAPVEDAPADPSIEASATIPAAETTAPDAAPAGPEAQAPAHASQNKGASTERRPKRPRAKKVASIELSKPPNEKPESANDPSSAPTDTVEPTDDANPKSP